MVFVLVLLKIDPNGDTLYYLDVVSSRVLRRKEGEAGTGSATDLDDLPLVFAATQGIDLYLNLLVRTDLLQLSFLEVSGYPQIVEWNDRQHVLTNRDVLAGGNVLLVDDAG